MTNHKNNNNFNNSQKRSDVRKNFFVILNRFLAVFIILNSVYFVVSINDLSIKGFVLQKLKASAGELARTNKNFELQITALESYKNIQKRAEELKLVKVDKIDYITITQETVAKK